MYKFEIGEKVVVTNHLEFPNLIGMSGKVSERDINESFNYYLVNLENNHSSYGHVMFYEEEIENIRKRREERLKKLLDK